LESQASRVQKRMTAMMTVQEHSKAIISQKETVSAADSLAQGIVLLLLLFVVVVSLEACYTE
jgi:hypothetical protein